MNKRRRWKAKARRARFRLHRLMRVTYLWVAMSSDDLPVDDAWLEGME
jgi:hypothetical protein